MIGRLPIVNSWLSSYDRRAMRFDHAFDVDAPAAAVYAALLDPERVGPCLPGATVDPPDADGAHPARITVKVGPMRMTYRGSVRIVERDAAERRAVLAADVRETRGQGSARARMTTWVAEAAGGRASVRSSTEVDLTGKAAQMGRGLIDDIAQRLVADMAERLGAMLAAESQPPQERAPAPAPASPPTAPETPTGPRRPQGDVGAAGAPPIGGLRLLARALLSRLRRLGGAR